MSPHKPVLKSSLLQHFLNGGVAAACRRGHAQGGNCAPAHSSCLVVFPHLLKVRANALPGSGHTLGSKYRQTRCMDFFCSLQRPRGVGNFTWSPREGEYVKIIATRMTVIENLLYVRQLGRVIPSGVFGAQ